MSEGITTSPADASAFESAVADEVREDAANIGIDLHGVGYAYPVIDPMKSLKIDLFKSVVGGDIVRKRGKIMVHALRDIDLSLRPGDRIGLLGPNGAGKTTLLRLIGDLLPASEGDIDVRGRIIPLIQQGVGIQPEFTGRQNIELPLRLLGASDAEVARAKKEIPDLIDLGSFIDLPVRTYSDGMRARLTFGISTFLKGDILLLDEWIGTGDAAFIKRANAHLKTYLAQTGILVIATHGMDLVRDICNRAAVLDSGRLIAVGDVEPMIELHEARMADAAKQSAAKASADSTDGTTP